MNILNVITFFTGVLGAVLLSFGAWLIAPAAGFIVSGLLALGWSYGVSRFLASKAA